MGADVLQVGELRDLISGASERVSSTVNTLLVMLYWETELRVRTEILKSARATYGEEVVPTVSAQLVLDFGDEFSTGLYQSRSPRFE